MEGNEAEIFIIAILGENNFCHFRGKKFFLCILGGKFFIFRGKFTYLNLESMTKNGYQKFWQMKRHVLGEKSHGKVSLAKFILSDSVNNFLK